MLTSMTGEAGVNLLMPAGYDILWWVLVLATVLVPVVVLLLVVRALRRRTATPARPVAERLAELDALRDAGSITPEEYTRARVRVLDSA